MQKRGTGIVVRGNSDGKLAKNNWFPLIQIDKNPQSDIMNLKQNHETTIQNEGVIS
jgi:hypothetical protein